MSKLQTQLHTKKDEKKEKTYALLRHQYTPFSESHKVLQEHLDESITTKEVLRNWYTYYVQVFQQSRETHGDIKTLESQQILEETIRRTIQDHIELESTNLEKLEK